MAVVMSRWAAVLILGFVVVSYCAPAVAAGGERDGHLLELAVAYGDSHLDFASNLVLTERGYADIPEYSLPYAIALLELGLSNSRAKAVLQACIATQDVDPKSPTVGQFRDTTASTEYSPSATAIAAVLLSRAISAHGDKLGDDFRATVRASVELCARALAALLRQTKDEDESLALHAAAARTGIALGDPAPTEAAVAMVRRWLAEIARGGRTWGPSPRADALRLLYLQWLWDACSPEARAPVDELLRLCLLDFAQRVPPGAGIPAGAVFRATPEDYTATPGFAASLIYRDLAGPLPERVTPFAATLALSSYVPPADLVSRPEPAFQPYQLTTRAQRELVPDQTDTYIAPQFTLGSMSGWCLPGTLPVMATFAAAQRRPTARFQVHGTPAHVSSLQFGNLVICSLNFDRMGVGQRLQAYVRGALGSVHDIEEVFTMGQMWNGEPIAIGARATVVVKRAGVYMAITLLDGGTADSEAGSRRKPGVLEWDGVGENAELTLTVYARQEEYRLRRPADDLKAGMVVQVWDAAQFPSSADVDNWLARSKINQRENSTTERTYQPRETHPILDRNKPQPKGKSVSRTVSLHTIEYSYLRGRGDTFVLVEDIRNERVLSRTANGVAIGGQQWWLTPAFSLMPGQNVAEALAPLTSPQAPVEPTGGEPVGQPAEPAETPSE
ncbi:MAG: hypothetical protein HPY44_16060 [Armatimonadetes bacterium]|nr:hypothetical protein [Armatimonadota bacterium]